MSGLPRLAGGHLLSLDRSLSPAPKNKAKMQMSIERHSQGLLEGSPPGPHGSSCFMNTETETQVEGDSPILPSARSEAGIRP